MPVYSVKSVYDSDEMRDVLSGDLLPGISQFLNNQCLMEFRSGKGANEGQNHACEWPAEGHFVGSGTAPDVPSHTRLPLMY